MRKLLGLVGATLLLAGPALAADLGTPPVYKAPALVPVFNWTGLYIGGNAGYGWSVGTSPVISASGGDSAGFLAGAGNVFPNLSPKGFIGGGQIGYDWQVSSILVLGVVADFQGADITASGASSLAANIDRITESLGEKLDFLGTGRVRLGFAANNWLFYGSGGVAYGHVQSTVSANDTLGVLTFAQGSASESRAGWAAGGGVNYAVTQNWILGVDYLHYDLGHTSVSTVDAIGASVNASQNVAGEIVRGLINYKF